MGRFDIHASLVVQTVKNLPAMQEMGIRSLGQEDPLEKDMTMHSSIVTWKIPWTEGLGGLQSMGSQNSETTEWLVLFILIALRLQYLTALCYCYGLSHK